MGQDLEITKDSDPSKIELGEQATFRIDVTNDTGATADIRIEDELPDEVTLVTLKRSDDGQCDLVKRTVKCS